MNNGWDEAWNDAFRMYMCADLMSCKPNPIDFPKYKFGQVIDEDKSVRWNREFVEKSLDKYNEEVKNLNRRKNEALNMAINKICELMVEDINKSVPKTKQIDMSKAKKIWLAAYNRGHDSGMEAIQTYLDEYINFTIEILA